MFEMGDIEGIKSANDLNTFYKEREQMKNLWSWVT